METLTINRSNQNCWHCGKFYKRFAWLYKHLVKQHDDDITSINLSTFQPSGNTEGEIDEKGNCSLCGMPKDMIQEGHFNKGTHSSPHPKEKEEVGGQALKEENDNL